jgi:Arc/MetJ-type ribon-helix-helix transcriptional regulator
MDSLRHAVGLGDNEREDRMSRKLEVVLPDEIGQAIDKAVESGNQTVDELVTEAVRRYLGRKSLDELSRYGAERAKEMGLDKLSEDEQIDYVNRTIKESRKENRNR